MTHRPPPVGAPRPDWSPSHPGAGASPAPAFPPCPPFPPHPPFPAYPPFPAQPSVRVVPLRHGGPSPASANGRWSAQGAGTSDGAVSLSSAAGGLSGPAATANLPIPAISLPPVNGYHNGTGVQHQTRLVVDPTSVAGSGPLQFVTTNVTFTTMLFALNEQVVPNWFGVAVPSGVTDFTKANIFFHPSPGQAHYLDSDYATKSGKWPQLLYYMERLGWQVEAARQRGASPNQIVIMPFLTSAATDTGILPSRWLTIVTDILTGARATTGQAGPPIVLSDVVVSSFSVGFAYSEAFRQAATGLHSVRSRIWDFDGYPKPESSDLVGPTVLKYDLASEPGSIHLPSPRWANLQSTSPPPGQDDWAVAEDLHHWVLKYMFLHAAMTFS